MWISKLWLESVHCVLCPTQETDNMHYIENAISTVCSYNYMFQSEPSRPVLHTCRSVERSSMNVENCPLLYIDHVVNVDLPSDRNIFHITSTPNMPTTSWDRSTNRVWGFLSVNALCSEHPLAEMYLWPCPCDQQRFLTASFSTKTSDAFLLCPSCWKSSLKERFGVWGSLELE